MSTGDVPASSLLKSARSNTTKERAGDNSRLSPEEAMTTPSIRNSSLRETPSVGSNKLQTPDVIDEVYTRAGSKDTSDIQATMILDEAISPCRARANTAPAKVASAPAPQATTAQPTEAIGKTANSDEDEEIKMARAMALAIANNPHLPPEEIRELVGAPKSVIGGGQVERNAKTVQLSTRFSSMIQDFDNLIKTGVASAATATQSATVNVPPVTSFRLGDNLRKYVGSASTTVASSEAPPSGLEAPSTGCIADADETMAKGFATGNAPSTATDAPLTGLSSKIAEPSTPASTDASELPNLGAGSSSKDASSATALASASRSRVPFRRSSSRSPSTVPSASNTADKRVLDKQSIQANLSELSSTESDGYDSVPSPGSSAAVLSMLPTSFKHAIANSSSGNSKTIAKKSLVIRLAALAWKRRGGMGKYSNVAWELRRIELVGTKLLYYRNDSEEDNADTAKATDAQSQTSEDQNPEAVIVSRRANWLEQATATWAAPSDMTSPRGLIDLAKEKALVSASYGDSGAPSPFAVSIKVRGETKWKLCYSSHNVMMEWLAAMTDVVVQASVDVYNASLLSAADPANVAAAESNPLFSVSSQPLPPPTAGGGGGNAQRLWMLEPYSIQSGEPQDRGMLENVRVEVGKFDGSESIEDDRVELKDFERLTVKAKTAPFVSSTASLLLDHTGLQERAEEESERAWSIPERSLTYVGIVVNLALCYARSSTTTADVFWYVVVATNVVLLLAMTHEPRWETIVAHVRDVSTSLTLQPDVDSSAVINDDDEGKSDQVTDIPTASTLPKTRFVPLAGSTTVKLKNPTDPATNSLSERFAGWCSPAPELMLVRSHGYLETKAKIPSPGQLYECVQVDIFESPQRYPDIGTRVKLPETHFTDSSYKKTWRTPDIFIVSIALPTDPPKFGRTTSDGGGYTITVYFRMLEETRAILRRVTADGYDPSDDQATDPQKSKVNAVRLLEEWCRRAPTDPKYQARFKVVPNAHNLDEIGMPNWIAKYNGKPFLVKRAGQTGFMYCHPEFSCMEFDVSLHPFPYLAKQAICFMKESYFKRILVSFGFCIEGRSDDELPECLIGAMQLCYPDPAVAIQGSDFFAGKSPNSFA